MKMLKKFALPLKSIWIDFSCRSIDVWYEVTGPFVRAWWRFEHWKRRRNPELVELDAFRELSEIERKLKDYPNAKPLLIWLPKLLTAFRALFITEVKPLSCADNLALTE